MSNLASIYEFLYEEAFYFFTFNFYYCLFSIFFMMLMKQVSNMKKLVLQGGGGLGKGLPLEGLQKISVKVGAVSKEVEGFLRRAVGTSQETMIISWKWIAIFLGNLAIGVYNSRKAAPSIICHRFMVLCCKVFVI